MKSADPRVKLLWAVVCTSGAVFFSKPWWMLGLTGFSLFGALLFGADLVGLTRRLKRFLPVLLMVAAVQVLFVRTGAPSWLWGGAGSAHRRWCLERFISRHAHGYHLLLRGRDGTGGQPEGNQFSYPDESALCFLLQPVCRPQVHSPLWRGLCPSPHRAAAAGSRSALGSWRQKLRLYSALLVPVLAETLARAENLAAVMEARGFGALPQRTIYVRNTMNGRDWAAVAVLLLVGVFAVRFYYAS